MQEIGLAFVEGLALIVSPCILPVLPIVLAASLTGGRRRPLGIILGFVASFALFTLLARQLVSLLMIDQQVLQQAAMLLLGGLGMVMLIPSLDASLSQSLKGLANWGDAVASKLSPGEGLRGGIVVGCLIGLVWTPCAGPVLAVATVQIITAKTDWQGALIVLMFAAGAATPMLAIALLGRKVMQNFGFLVRHAVRLRQGLGLVLIAASLLLYTGVTNQLLANADTPPISTLEGNMLTSKGLQHGLAQPVQAPEFAGIEAWLNSQPLTMAGLRGKVVLIDFWTYSCINCIRTLPYVTAWDRAYREHGLVVVGVHAPEFEFEKKTENVANAIKAHGIAYPVAQDNKLATWSAFANSYWPAHYLINQEGRIVYTHFGEGGYDVMEHNIRTLLGLNDAKRAEAQPSATGEAGRLQTHETYLGYGRAEKFSSKESARYDAAAVYTYPDFLLLNHWALAGNWHIGRENITAQAGGAKLRLNFYAGRVFLVLGSASGQPVQASLTLNGKPLGSLAGKDVQDGKLTVTGPTLYELVNQGDAGNGILEITAENPGLQAFAFTFGS